MLCAGDMVWHRTNEWFHRCILDRVPPAGIDSSQSEMLVARDPTMAETWNMYRRDELWK